MTSASDGQQKKPLADYSNRELYGHKRRVYTLGWSSSGRKLASGASDSSVRVWTVDQYHGKAERSDVELKGHAGAVAHVSWKPSSDSVLASTANGDKTDKSVRVWDVKSGKCTATVPTSVACTYVSWSPDASSLAALSEDNTISIVDVRKARVFKSIRFSHEVYEVHWGPTNQQLMLCTAKGSVDVMAMPHFENSLWSLKGHSGHATCMATNKSYKLLASGGGDALICLWDFEAMVPIRTWAHMDSPVRTLSISADGSMLAYSTEGGAEMEVLSTITGERLHEFRLRTTCECVAWNPVHPVLAYCDDVMDPSAPRGDHRPGYVGVVNIYAPPKPSS